MTASEGSEPVYLRLRRLLASGIIDGRYAEGTQLPSVRVFAAQQGANPLTVAKAYQSLQDDGTVIVRRGVGMFVAAGAGERLRDEGRRSFLAETWPQVRAQMDRLGIDPKSLLRGEPA